MTEIFKKVHKGIDSLYLSFKGTLNERFKEELEQKKLFAQSDDEKVQALATITIDEHTFEVKDRGKGRYAYVLVDSWYHIQISASKKKMLPTIYVQLSSDLLNCFGVSIAMNQLRGTMKELLDGIEEETVSRADFFVDFITETDLSAINKKSWITRSKGFNNHWSGDRFTGFSIGLGGDISARLYNKTIEIEKSKKDYLMAFWSKNGWDKTLNVWRLEFQLKREVLKQLSINKAFELGECSNDIWLYCTQKWLRLAYEEKTKNRTRWQTHPLWAEIEQVKFGDGNYTGIIRDISRSRVPIVSTLFLNGMGYLTNYAALKGYDSINDTVVLEFCRDAKEFLKKHTENSSYYQDENDYLVTKINSKKKKYNKPLEQEKDI
ncbi:MAG: hypothetical protein HYS21_02555 [Deltaproteobacteria bacterium]|nr:hypothetical protein [Deltaproteobacteria bacterium]